MNYIKIKNYIYNADDICYLQATKIENKINDLTKTIIENNKYELIIAVENKPNHIVVIDNFHELYTIFSDFKEDTLELFNGFKVNTTKFYRIYTKSNPSLVHIDWYDENKSCNFVCENKQVSSIDKLLQAYLLYDEKE